MLKEIIIKEKEINNLVTIYSITITSMTNSLKKILDNRIGMICEADSDVDLKILKNDILSFLNSKDEVKKIGAISEFFIHLFLNEIGFTQECLFLNLEENSVKKGFDGYYSKKSEHWIMESKSGFITTKNISHKNKVNEAYKDLKTKIAGKQKKNKNNPWKNAYNHAFIASQGKNTSIYKVIKKLSKEYSSKKYHDIKNFNIIPCGTIFLKNTENIFDEKIIIEEIQEITSGMEYKKAILIGMTKSSIDIFINYLENEGDINE